MRESWTKCPACFAGKGEDHRRDCPRSKRRRLRNLTAEYPPNRGAETMFGKPVPLQPVTEAEPYMRRATSVVKPHD